MVTEGYAWPMVAEPSETRTRYLVGNERAAIGPGGSWKTPCGSDGRMF